MKKHISYVDLDPSLLQWLIEKLSLSPSTLQGSEELRESFKALLSGESHSLMLELDDILEESRPSVADIHIGELCIRPPSREVTRKGIAIPLTPKEFDILYFLARNRGEVFTKEQIYQAVWDDTYLMDDSNIMAFIRKLRKKIEPNPDSPEYILTIWGVGYKCNERI